MAKIDQFINGEVGLSVRTKVNKALQSVAFSEMETGAWINDDTMATATATTFATSASIKAYIDSSEAGIPAIKSYTFKSKASNGIEYMAGYYEGSATDANLTQASLTVTDGTANVAYGGHVFIVAGGAGVTDGSDLVLTVTGTSITDAGVRTGSDSEVIVTDCTALALDEYVETSKKWLGQTVITLSSTGGATFNVDFNYGLAKYDDIGNVSFQVDGLECVGEAGANDTGFNIQLLLHDGTGWTYHATAFVPGGTVLADMNVDYSTESNLINNEYFAYKRTGLNTLVDGTASEGILIRVTTSANNAVDYMDAHLQFLFTDSIIT